MNTIMKLKFKPDKEFEVIAYNALKLDKQELNDYIKEKLEGFKAEGARSLPTSFRRLLMIFDFIINKG